MKRLLRAWLWMLIASLAFGLALGTCVRREAERPETYIGGMQGPTTFVGGTDGLETYVGTA